MLDYKNFDYTKIKIESIDDCIKILDMFAYQHFKRECAMNKRDDKWGYGISAVASALEPHRNLFIPKTKNHRITEWIDFDWTKRYQARQKIAMNKPISYR